MQNFREEVFNYLNNNKLSGPLNCGINIDQESLPCTISICSPVNGAKKIEDCMVFILTLPWRNNEEYGDYIEKALDIFKYCIREKKQLKLSIL